MAAGKTDPADTKPNARIPSPSIAPADLAIDRVHLARMTLGDKRLEAEVLALFDPHGNWIEWLSQD